MVKNEFRLIADKPSEVKNYGQLAIAQHIVDNNLIKRVEDTEKIMFVVETPNSIPAVVLVTDRIVCNCVLMNNCCHRMAVELKFAGRTKAESFDIDLLAARRKLGGLKPSGKKGPEEYDVRVKRAKFESDVPLAKAAERVSTKREQTIDAKDERTVDAKAQIDWANDTTSEQTADESTDPPCFELSASGERVDTNARFEELAKSIGENNWLSDRVLDELTEQLAANYDNPKFLVIPTGLVTSTANLTIFMQKHMRSEIRFLLVILNSVDSTKSVN